MEDIKEYEKINCYSCDIEMYRIPYGSYITVIEKNCNKCKGEKND